MSSQAELAPPDTFARHAGTVKATPDVSVVRRALTDAVPIALGYVPFAIVIGATIAASSLPRGATWLATPLLFAGAAQLALVDLLEVGVAPLVVIATALAINLRLVMYSGAIAPTFRSASPGTRLAAAAFVIDPVYTMTVARFSELRDDAARRRYWFALGLTLWCVWQLEIALGFVVGNSLPAAVPLDLAAPLTFLAMLMPMLTSRPTVAAAVAAGAVAIAARDVPLHLGLIIGALAGVAVGMLLANHIEETS